MHISLFLEKFSPIRLWKFLFRYQLEQFDRVEFGVGTGLIARSLDFYFPAGGRVASVLLRSSAWI